MTDLKLDSGIDRQQDERASQNQDKLRLSSD